MSSLANRRILLIGGAGFIGHHLSIGLDSLGAEVSVLDSLAVNNYYHFKNHDPDLLPNGQLYLRIIEERLDLIRSSGVRLIEQDARDYHRVSEIVAALEVDTIIHLAAVSHAGKSNKDPYSTFDHNFRTLENALDAARSVKVDRFVFFSSSMVYGTFPSESVTEEVHCEPLGIYGALKYGGEKLVIAYNQVFDLPYTIIRPSALYGPRCVSRRVGQVFIENALNGLEVTIGGDGCDRLDFTYIDDLVSGVYKVLEHTKAENQIFNLTFGQSRSIGEMAALLREHFPSVRIKYVPKDRLMPDRGTLSIEKARKLLGYEPQYPLDLGFVKYIEWYRSIWDRYGTVTGAAT